MRRHDLGKRIYRHIKELQKARVCQKSGLFSKIILGTLILMFFQACAPALYNVNLKYEPSEKFLKSEKTKPGLVLTVAMFNDMRQTKDKLQLGTVTNINGDTIPILPKNAKVPDAVTKNVREYFLKSGYRVSNNIPIWDLREQTINKDWGKILVGGNID